MVAIHIGKVFTQGYLLLLFFLVPPRWTVEPVDSNVAAGQEATLNCQAAGYPTPAITWKRAVGKLANKHRNTFNFLLVLLLGSQPGEYKDFLFEPNVQQQSNGSLTFKHISKENEGQYLCEGKNNIGTGVSKVIFLKVNGKNANDRSRLCGFIEVFFQHRRTSHRKRSRFKS